jgi:hypothetical protein
MSFRICLLECLFVGICSAVLSSFDVRCQIIPPGLFVDYMSQNDFFKICKQKCIFLLLFFCVFIYHVIVQDTDLRHPCLLKSPEDTLISSRATSGSYIA